MNSHRLSPESRILVAGHRGMVGSAIVRALRRAGHEQLITASHAELELREQAAVERFLAASAPDAVIIAAARVGGIHANNTYPAEFLYDNLMIEANLIHAAHRAGVQSLLFLGSSCIYPKHCPQPIREDYLLSGPLEPTNAPYAIAKIAGLALCDSYRRQYGRDYRSLMPTNLYGPGDNFHPTDSHVIPALLRRFHEAKAAGDDQVTVWGTGRARREFLYVDDLAEACVRVLALPEEQFRAVAGDGLNHLNVGTGVDLSIRKLAERIAEVVGFRGELRFDTDKPDGTPRKLLDVSRIHRLGWQSRTELAAGLNLTYQWYQANPAR